jgi:hypothetical protein
MRIDGRSQGQFAVWRKPGTRLLVDDPVEEAALDFRQQADSIATMLVVV